MNFEDWTRFKGRVVVMSGPSGVGKTTLARRLLNRKEVRVAVSVSATTRGIREGEQDGRDYIFWTREKFQTLQEKQGFLEWAEVHGEYYGTPIEPVRNLLAQGICPLLVIDVQGGLQVKNRVPNSLLIWVEPPSLRVLEERLRGRGTDESAVIERRLENARREMAIAEEHYPRAFHIPNESDREEEAVDRIVDVLREHGCGG